MSVRSLNGLGGSTNVYVNTNLSATEPVLVNQTSFTNPIVVSLKGLTGFGTAGQVIKVNSTANGLIYATDEDNSNWSLSGNQLYPNSQNYNLVLGTTNGFNSNNRKLLIAGDGDLNGKLYFNDSQIFITNQAGYLQYNTEYKSGAVGGEHQFKVEDSGGTQRQVFSASPRGVALYGRTEVNSGYNEISLFTGSGSNTLLITNYGTSGGSPYVEFSATKESGTGTSDYYYIWKIEGTEYMRLSTNGLTGSLLEWKAQPVAEIYGGTHQSSYTTGDILYASATNTLSKLPIGSAGKILKVSSGGIPEWAAATATFDPTTAQNFGTAVSGGNTIKLGNIQGTGVSVNLELYTSATLKLFNTSNAEIARFTPVSNSCNLTLNGGSITTTTMGANTTWNGNAIAYNYGGTGLTSLVASKILQVNTNANGFNLVDMPAAVQYWSLSAGVLSPSTSSNTVRCESGLRLGTAGEFIDMDYNTGTNIFDIIHHDGGTNTEVFEYNASTGFITWGTQVGIMNFNSYTLKILALQGKSTSNHVINESASGWRAFGDFKFDDPITINQIEGENSSTNLIKDDSSRGWEFQSVLDSRMIAMENGSYYPFIGLSDSSNISFLIHINNIGDAYYINRDSNSLAGLRHEFRGNCISVAANTAAFKHTSPYTYFYDPHGTNGAASFTGSYWSYHDNGTAIYFNLPSGSTSSGAYYGFATSNSQKARIDMSGSGKITGSWTGSWAGTSDRRLKKNIVPIENAVDTLMKINIYQFDKYDIDNYDCIHSDCGGEDCLKPFKDRLSENTRFVYGFIAQELCENTPEIGKMCVETNGWGEEEPAYIIDDRPMLACAIKTIQEQQQQINNLTNIINKLIESPSFKSFKQKLE